MGRGVLLILALFAIEFAQALEIDPSAYIYPLEGVEGLYSGNFGEFRSDHFHSGVDIKTGGVIGKRVVAVGDGYISRVGFSPYGFGLALYITHPNGTTSVYAHLESFRDDIAARVQKERYAQKKHSITLHFRPDEYPVKQGERIAYSGNSGSSAGPHLHYEVRESSTQRPLNIFAHKIISPRDTRRPIHFSLHYIEVDSLDGVVYRAPIQSFSTNNISLGQYTLKSPNNTIKVGRKGYFIIECGDRKDGVTNRFGVYTLEGRCDGERFFSYRMDGFLFSDSRYVNSVSDYALSQSLRNEVIRLSGIECGTTKFYEELKNGGVIECAPSQQREIVIVATDDVGLQATLKFNIIGREQSFKAEADTLHPIARATEKFTYKGEGIEVTIPPKSLYESIPFLCERLDVCPVDSTLITASAVYRILSPTTPLHKAMKISLTADIDEKLQPHAAVAKLTKQGSIAYVGGKYEGGKVTTESRSAGEYLVVADTIPPTIKLLNVGAKAISFEVKDNFSGIKSYNALVNGEWVALDLDRSKLTHIFTLQPTLSEEVFRLEVEDGCGNISVMEQKFRR